MKRKALKLTKIHVLILLVCTLTLSAIQLPKVTADVTLTVDPTSGHVTDAVFVNGTIETEGGFFIVRWNGELNITTGYALGVDVQTTFIVPQTDGAPTGRDILVELIDNTTNSIGTANFKLYTNYHVAPVTPSPPLQLQEGANTTLWLNVTGGEQTTSYVANVTVEDPANNTYAAMPQLTTNTTGYGDTHVSYPEDFGTQAHTNYTGTYTVTFNETETTFQIGLANATEYTIFQTVDIQAANYTHPAEHAWVNITHNGETVFSQNVTALNSLVHTRWTIPIDAPTGDYMITVSNATTPGTQKPIDDTQQFTVKKPIFTVEINATNLGGEPLSDILVEAYNGTVRAAATSTNATGVATLQVEMANYTFKAFSRDVEVGVLPNQSIIENKISPKALPLTCNLTTINIRVTDEASTPMPFISLTANYSYTTRTNASKQETLVFTTNYTGTWKIRNTFTNISYLIEAQRYGHIFNQTQIERMPISPTFDINLALPTLTATVQVVDAKNNAAAGFTIEAHEYTKGAGEPDQSSTTNAAGNVTFTLTFGKYNLRAYKDAVFLNETTIDLIRDQSFTFHLATFNVDLKVRVIDYFGQPIPNALVEIQHLATTESLEDTTAADGHVTFSNILGGNSRIIIYVKEQLTETRDLYLTNSRQLTFSITRYVTVVGYVMEISQFVTAIAIAILIAGLVVALTYKRIYKLLSKKK